MLSFKQKDRATFLHLFLLISLAHLLMFLCEVPSPGGIKSTLKERRSRQIRVTFFPRRHQIVESQESQRKDISPSAFLSDRSRSFERQTRTSGGETFNSGPSAGGANGKAWRDLRLSDLSLTGKDHPLLMAARKYAELKRARLSESSGASKVTSTTDYLPEIPLGLTTALNTAEYKYYGFYHRIRQRLEQFWRRAIQEKARLLEKARRRIGTEQELITALEIVLNATGEIVAIKLRGSCGVKELDDAAIESFTQAGPFPNPPQGLLINGKVHLQWGFVVKS